MVSGPVRIQGTIHFGEDFELDLRAYELRRAERSVKLERIPMEVLQFLIEHRNELVTREQIVERIWGKDVFLDTDNSINGAIRKIRQALRDDPEQPRFVQTVVGQGYRFIASVAEERLSPLTEPDQVPGIPTAPQGDAEPEPQPHGTRAMLWLAPSIVALALVLTAGWLVRSRSKTTQSPPARVMLAVLPFQNLTGDPSQEYFSDGLTEEMITQLGNLDPQRLGVIARTSVMHYKTTQAPLDQVGRELGVQYVIEGSVRRDAGNVRVTAQLIQTKDQTHIWSRQYDRELKALLTLQGEIAREIADEIQLTFGDHKPAAPTLSPLQYEAYDLYLKGQYFLNKRTVGDLEEAIAYFQAAVAKNPNDARAYAGMADSYSLLSGYSSRPQGEFVAKARVAALKALEIDDHLPEAHAALALIVQNNDWDWQTAEKEFRRAMELNPNYATAHHWYAEHLMWRGRFDEALQESEKARQLDPLSLIIAADNGAILYFSRRYDRAIDKFRSVLEVDPAFPRAQMIQHAFVEKGMFAEARADLEKQRASTPTAWYWCNLTYIYGRSGQTAQAQSALHRLLQEYKRRPVDTRMIAAAYAGIGDKEQTLAWLEKAYAQHSNELVGVKIDPAYDPLRSDPRFQDLIRRVGLAN